MSNLPKFKFTPKGKDQSYFIITGLGPINTHGKIPLIITRVSRSECACTLSTDKLMVKLNQSNSDIREAAIIWIEWKYNVVIDRAKL